MIGRKATECKTSQDASDLIAQLVKFKDDGALLQNGRLNNMECIATDLYGKFRVILKKLHDFYAALLNNSVEEQHYNNSYILCLGDKNHKIHKNQLTYYLCGRISSLSILDPALVSNTAGLTS